MQGIVKNKEQKMKKTAFFAPCGGCFAKSGDSGSEIKK
jgi:hypothetical protein